jgi:hypothetical protein
MNQKELDKKTAQFKKAKEEMLAQQRANDARVHGEYSPLRYDHTTGEMKETK